MMAARAPVIRQRGSLMIMFTLLLVVVIGFMGLALDLAQLYNRKVELQNLADAAALAAARPLSGTGDGIAQAVAQAKKIAEAHTYQYGSAIGWTRDDALSFGATPDGPWTSVADAYAAPQDLHYARIDTAGLGEPYGRVATLFLNALDGLASSSVADAVAVAGRSAVPVVPFAVCAMNGQPNGARDNDGTSANRELVQYGFRHGVGYNLLKLNPAPGASAGAYFTVHALGAPGSADAAMVAPFMCSGKLAVPRLIGQRVAVQPAGAFHFSAQLNSRFNEYGTGPLACKPNGARPDKNVAEYGHGNADWMGAVPDASFAAPAPQGSAAPLRTVADVAGTPAPGAASYGPLWAYGPAMKFAAAPATPAAPYGRFAKGDWPKLYPVAPSGSATANANYQSVAPYARTSGPQFLAPPSPQAPALANRRLLNVPLLDCSSPGAPGATPTVLAIARFLLLARADSSQVSAEFAGLVLDESAFGAVELMQ